MNIKLDGELALFSIDNQKVALNIAEHDLYIIEDGELVITDDYWFEVDQLHVTETTKFEFDGFTINYCNNELSVITELDELIFSIKRQFNEMLDRGVIPLFEIEIKGGEYLTVDLSVNDKGVLFSFDSDGLSVSFDGEIKAIDSNHYLLPYSLTCDDLDSYFYLIRDNLLEGYLLPNNLLREF